METTRAAQIKKPYIRLDPRTKLLVLLTGSFAALSAAPKSAEVMLILFLTLLLLNERQTGFAVKLLAVFAAMLLPDIFGASLLDGAAGVVLLAVTRIVRIYLPVCMAFTLVVKTTTVSAFIAALCKMHVSDKITIPVSVMFRFIPTVKEEWQAIRAAMKFRGIGISFKSVAIRPMLTLEYVMIPLLMSASGIAGELAAASLARGLDSGKARTCVTQVALGPADYPVMLAGLAIAVCAVAG
ncbi:energy-coupling factor transport system permease protein [Sporobacter termitidis DSM 10068]|uniref:Energy-coupling factor transport system permease protein n=1 Tax=Sporobacter termitidis DSM 10068 TaxID=1123282 RepID=A0A1M5ZGQ4_9FIRM|nr:energy-coupling factor transporter transmembrane component T [Sporobacter termitidis]SHI23083.1 energy-coupling factor transport system permease protein [Sporobacter termitidis DSM 10068]